MSITRKVYLITGLEIQNALTDKWEDWKYRDKIEEYLETHSEGKIEIIEDGFCGEYTYLGYVHASAEDDDSFVETIDPFDVKKQNIINENILQTLKDLAEFGVINFDKVANVPFKYILFSHYW